MFNVKRKQISTVSRAAFFVLVACCFFFLSRSFSSATLLPALSPFTALGAAIALRGGSFLTLLALPVTIIAIFRKRWFCRYLCPAGLLTEAAGKLRRRPPTTIRSVPAIGVWVLIITLTGALFSYPFFLWLDPLSLFSAFLWACFHPTDTVSLVAGAGLPLILLVGMLVPGIWCLKLCPLGALQEMLFRLKRASSRKKKRSTHREGMLSRRMLFGAAAGAFGGIFLRIKPGRSRTLRPPLAIAEPAFTALCLRCGNCIQKCPEKILRPDTSLDTLKGFLAPVVSFEKGYCKKECSICMDVCPSGAIANRPLEEKWKNPIGMPVVRDDICLLNKTECRLCINHCPYEAISTTWDEESYQARLNVTLSKCPGCGACEQVCPTEPEKAIRIEAVQRLTTA